MKNGMLEDAMRHKQKHEMIEFAIRALLRATAASCQRTHSHPLAAPAHQRPGSSRYLCISGNGLHVYVACQVVALLPRWHRAPGSDGIPPSVPDRRPLTPDRRPAPHTHSLPSTFPCMIT